MICRRVAVVLVALALAGPRPADAASKTTIAAIGDAAPGGGVFAGPGFSDWPAAAGKGWIAFRSQITGGTSTEALVVAHMTAPASRAEVATLGQPAPSGGAFAKCTGKLKQFLGPPTVNANGDVAFVALVEPPPSTSDTFSVGPTPAGIFVYRGGTLVPIACSGQETASGILDLVAVIDVFSDVDTDVAERAPAMNDAGDVAFLTGYVNSNGFPTGGAVVFAPRAGGFTEVARLDQPFDTGKFQSFGPPALNGAGTIVFHGLATTTDQSNGGLLDGVFVADRGGVRVLVRNGIAPMPLDQPVFEFQDDVAINDRGDVAFLAGPLVSDTSLEDAPGVMVWSAGVVTLVAYPGQKLGPDTVTGVTLGPLGGSQIAPPALAPDGTLFYFVSLNGGNGEAIVRWDGQIALPIAYTAGTGADASPVGGLYAGTESAPAVDATGGIVFLVRVSGGLSSQAIVYRAGDGTLTPIVLGDAAPEQTAGFFGGKPFTSAHLNDAGDVVFRAFVSRGPASVGIFRARDGNVDAVVRGGDPAPIGGAFLDLIGEPGIDENGDVAFAAEVAEAGRGIFVADAAGLHAIVLRGDAAPGEAGTVFGAIGPNPQIADSGAVAFRATTLRRDPLTGISIKHDGIFLHDANGMRVLVFSDEPSPEGLPFLKLRDPFLVGSQSVVFRAPLGVGTEASSGIFFSDATGTSAIAVEQQPLGAGVVLTGFSGNPSVTASGQVAFVASRARPDDPGGPPIHLLGPAIMKRGADGLDLVVARDMPGPNGGTFRTLSSPAINAAGHVLFRGSFNQFTGGTSGFFVHDDAGLAPYVLRGEVAPLGGRFTSLGSAPALNGADEVAFSAQVNGGKARSGLFLATPTKLDARLLSLRLSDGRGKDRVALRAVLTVGRVSNGIHPAKDTVAVSLSDAAGVLWSASVRGKDLSGHDASWAIVPKRASDLGHQLQSLRLRIARKGTVIVGATSAAVDLTRGGIRTPKPPFRVTVEAGDDQGSVAVPCTLGRRRTRCR
jgi:hypothetical protein